MAPFLPTTQDICATVVEELTLVGGTVSDEFDDGSRLFLRAILPTADKVQPKDTVQGGIAVMVDEEEVEVRPYVFREVCRNGAIMPQLMRARHILRVDFSSSSDAVEAVDRELREALRACAAAEVFSENVQQMKSGIAAVADVTVFHTLLLLSQIPHRDASAFSAEIMRRYSRDRDRSVFGLANAVTSVARDQEDPEVRWRLEELGGGVLARMPPRTKPHGSAARPALSEVTA